MQPKISVIVPAYNEEKLVGKCIEAIKNQIMPQDQYEIIVVDNGSSDKTASVAKSYGVKVFTYKDIQGCGASRKFGSTHAKGSIVAFTDADSEPFPNWLERIDKVFQDPNVVCVGGRAVPDEKSVLSNAIFAYYDFFHLSHRMLNKPLMGGYNMAIRKSAYDAVGGFDETLLACDDWDLALKLQKRYGTKSVLYDLGLVVQASSRKTTSLKTFSQYFNDHSHNYFDIIIRGKKRAKPTFTVR